MPGSQQGEVEIVKHNIVPGNCSVEDHVSVFNGNTVRESVLQAQGVFVIRRLGLCADRTFVFVRFRVFY